MKPTSLPISVALALLMHALLLVVLIWQGSVIHQPKPEPIETYISATLGEDPAIARRKKQQQEDARKRANELKKQQEQEQERKKRLEVERKERERQAAEKKRQEEAAHKKEQQKAQNEAAAKKKAEEQRQAEQQKQLQLKRKQEEEQRRKTAAEQQRAEEDRIKRAIEERRAKEAADQLAEERRVWEESERLRSEKRAEQAKVDASAIGDMKSILLQMVSTQWIRPPGISSELETTLEVRLLGTGELVNNGVRIVKTSGNSAFDRSAVQAIEKAAPFPLLSLEPRQREEFRRIIFVFTPEDLTL